MRDYRIERATVEPTLDPAAGDAAWEGANELPIDQFSWSEGGFRPATTVWLLYDDEALYFRTWAEDRAISSRVTEHNGPTFEDSSVELFADPTPGEDSFYFNFEVNCCGFFKLAWQADDPAEQTGDRDMVPPDLAEEVRVGTTVEGPTREPRPGDESWELRAAIPFAVLEALTGVGMDVGPGTEWRGNCYRSGVPDEQKASWNPIDLPEPVYHSPEYFGRLVFD